jgi:hypothetical membrane protein
MHSFPHPSARSGCDGTRSRSEFTSMVRSRTSGFLGIAAAVMCWSALLVFGALRPSYSHTANAVSELGARGSLHALPWNLIGFIAPGILLAMACGAIAASVDAKPRRTVAFWLFVISGLGFAGTGLSPAEMENGVALVTSPFTKGHFIMSLIHGIAWMIAALLLVRPMLRRPDWRKLTYINVALVIATLVASFALRGRLSDALVQRIAGAIYFAWFVVMSVRLIRIDRKQFQVTG